MGRESEKSGRRNSLRSDFAKRLGIRPTRQCERFSLENKQNKERKGSQFLLKCHLGTHMKNGGEVTGPFSFDSFMFEKILPCSEVKDAGEGLENPFFPP